MNFFFKLFLLAFLLQGCFSSEKKDIISVTINKEKLQQDISILRGIVMDMHAGAYAYNTPEQLENLFDSISNSIIEPISTREFYNKAAYIIDRLKCIHSEVLLPDGYYDSIENKSLFFPMPLIEINNKLYVNSEMFTIPLAAEILSVNSNPANKIINKMGIYRHTDGNRDVIKENMIDEDFSMNYYMAYGGAAEFIIKYKTYKNDTVRTVTFTADKLQTIYKDQYDDTYFFYPEDAPYDFEILNKKKTAILTVRSFSYATKAKDDAYNHFIENAFRMIRQNKIKNLVIDCRNNDGGYYSNTFLLLSYLVNKKMVEFDSAVKRFDKFTYTTFVDTDDTAKIIAQYQDVQLISLKDFVSDKINAPNKAKATVCAIGLNIFPSIPCKVKMGK